MTAGTGFAPVAAVALFMRRPDPGDRMPARIRKFALWVFLVGFGGAGAVVWLAAGRVLPQDAAAVGVTGIAWGVGVYCVVTLLDVFMSRCDAHTGRRVALQEIRVAAAADCAAAGTFAELAADTDPEVRCGVARNTGCPHDVLDRLSTDRYRSVRKAVALNPAAPEALLLRIVDAGDLVVCSAMLASWSGESPAVRARILSAAPT